MTLMSSIVVSRSLRWFKGGVGHPHIVMYCLSKWTMKSSINSYTCNILPRNSYSTVKRSGLELLKKEEQQQWICSSWVWIPLNLFYIFPNILKSFLDKKIKCVFPTNNIILTPLWHFYNLAIYSKIHYDKKFQQIFPFLNFDRFCHTNHFHEPFQMFIFVHIVGESSALGYLATFFVVMGKYGITGAFSSVFLFTSELYPTNLRYLTLLVFKYYP